MQPRHPYHTSYIFPQLARVARKFGGNRALSLALRRVHRYHPASSYSPMAIGRWSLGFEYPGGMAGIIPPWNLPAVLHAARLYGVVITPHDLFGGAPLIAPSPADRRGRRRAPAGGDQRDLLHEHRRAVPALPRLFPR
jgi:hypothetical protein